jgi:hypothetical protein
VRITIDIKAEVRAELGRRAAETNVDLDVYAARLLESAAGVPAVANRLTKSQLENTLRDLAQFSHKIPLLPDRAFSREGLYQDHD